MGLEVGDVVKQEAALLKIDESVDLVWVSVLCDECVRRGHQGCRLVLVPYHYCPTTSEL
jgi:hypothetical protein